MDFHGQPNHVKQARIFFHKPEDEILSSRKVDVTRDDKKDEAISRLVRGRSLDERGKRFTRPKNWALRSTPDFSRNFVKRQKEKTRGEIRGQNLRLIKSARLPCDQGNVSHLRKLCTSSQNILRDLDHERF